MLEPLRYPPNGQGSTSQSHGYPQARFKLVSGSFQARFTLVSPSFHPRFTLVSPSFHPRLRPISRSPRDFSSASPPGFQKGIRRHIPKTVVVLPSFFSLH